MRVDCSLRITIRFKLIENLFAGACRCFDGQESRSQPRMHDFTSAVYG